MNDSMSFNVCNSSICIDIDKPGEYIATVRFADGSEVRYGIEAKAAEDKFYYHMRTLKEQPTASYGEEDKYDIGKYSIWPNNYDQIADVTREPAQIRSTSPAKKQAPLRLTTSIKSTKAYLAWADSTGECYGHIMTGIQVNVERIGSIIHVRASGNMMSDH